MEFEAMPLVPAQTVRVRFTDAGPLPPPKHFSEREDATMATTEEELTRTMRESERMRQFNRPLNRREQVALEYLSMTWMNYSMQGHSDLLVAEEKIRSSLTFADLFCRIADATAGK